MRILISELAHVRTLSLHAAAIVLGATLFGLLGIIGASALLSAFVSPTAGTILLVVGMVVLPLLTAAVMYRDLYGENVIDGIRGTPGKLDRDA